MMMVGMGLGVAAKEDVMLFDGTNIDYPNRDEHFF